MSVHLGLLLHCSCALECVGETITVCLCIGETITVCPRVRR